jgi:hypothetical protein
VGRRLRIGCLMSRIRGPNTWELKSKGPLLLIGLKVRTGEREPLGYG